MLKNISLTSIAVAAALFGCVAVAVAVSVEFVEDFETAPSFTKENKVVDAAVCEVVKDPSKAGNHVLKLTWPKHTATHIACNYNEIKVPLMDLPGTYKIKARVNMEQMGSECQNMALRILDAHNETFQLSVRLDKIGEPGWNDVTWVLNTDTPDTGGVSSWGANVDGVVDLPVRLLGFAVGFSERSTNGGTMLIDDISVTKEDAK